MTQEPIPIPNILTDVIFLINVTKLQRRRCGGVFTVHSFFDNLRLKTIPDRDVQLALLF